MNALRVPLPGPLPGPLALAALLALPASGAHAAPQDATPVGLFGARAAPEQLRPDFLPPLGVDGQPLLEVDGFTLSYRLERTVLEGLREGTDRRSSDSVFSEGYALAPTDMVLDEHLFRGEFGLGSNVSLALNLPVVGRELTQQSAAGERTSTKASRLGDVRLGARFDALEDPDQSLTVALDVSLPTGSINEREAAAGGGEPELLPYALRSGSGTWDLWPRLLFVRYWSRWSFGALASAVLRTGETDQDYTLGDRFSASAWVARRIDRDHSLSVRFAAHEWEDIDGADPRLDPALTPLHDPGAQGGRRLDAYAGIHYVGVAGHRFSLEVGGPLFQDLDGPQLEADLVAWLGWRYAW